VDLASGALLAVTLQPASDGDTSTIHRTLAEAQSAAREINERTALLHRWILLRHSPPKLRSSILRSRAF
jgi:hypothetical protein